MDLIASGVQEFMHAASKCKRFLHEDAGWRKLCEFWVEQEFAHPSQTLELIGFIPDFAQADKDLTVRLMDKIAEPTKGFIGSLLYEPFIRQAFETFGMQARRWLDRKRAMTPGVISAIVKAQSGKEGRSRVHIETNGEDKLVQLNWMSMLGVLMDRLPYMLSEHNPYAITEVARDIVRLAEAIASRSEPADGGSPPVMVQVINFVSTLVEQVRPKCPRVYPDLFTYVTNGPAELAGLFVDSALAQLLSLLRAMVSRRTHGSAQEWRQVMNFLWRCRHVWNIDVPGFPDANEIFFRELAPLWNSRLDADEVQNDDQFWKQFQEGLNSVTAELRNNRDH
jgi:hypothetical protein